MNHQCSPVVLLLKVANRDEAGATADSKLVLLGRPLYAAGGAVDPQDDQGGLPRLALQCPHVRVAVRATGHNAIALWGPVNTWDKQLPVVIKHTTSTDREHSKTNKWKVTDGVRLS